MNRTLWIVAGITVVALLAAVWPQVLVAIIQRPLMIVLAALMPFAPLVVLILIIYAVLNGMIGSLFRGGRRGRR